MQQRVVVLWIEIKRTAVMCGRFLFAFRGVADQAEQIVGLGRSSCDAEIVVADGGDPIELSLIRQAQSFVEIGQRC